MPEIGIGFDRADAIWLAGYANVIAGQADFLLAHDFSEFLNAIGHRFFPKAGFPMQDVATGGTAFIDPQSDTAIADVIAAIHTINWPVVEPDRLKRVLARGAGGDRAVAPELGRDPRRDRRRHGADPVADRRRRSCRGPTVRSRRRWSTPGSRRSSRSRRSSTASCCCRTGGSQNGGFDLKAYFETATKTDLVMILTGYGALPFIKDGPVADAETFAEADRVFGGNLMGYAFWFN